MDDCNRLNWIKVLRPLGSLQAYVKVRLHVVKHCWLLEMVFHENMRHDCNVEWNILTCRSLKLTKHLSYG